MKKIVKALLNMLFIFIFVFLVISLGYTLYTLYQAPSVGELLDTYLSSRYIIFILIAAMLLVVSLLLIISKKNKKKFITAFLSLILLMTSLGFLTFSNKLSAFENSLENISNTTVDTEVTVKFIALSSSNISEMSNVTLGILNNTESKEGFILPTEYIESKEGVTLEIKGDTWDELVTALLNGEVDVIALPKNYNSILASSETYLQSKDLLIEVDSYTKTYQNQNVEIKDASKPINVLLTGIDTALVVEGEDEITTEHLFDVIVIATIDPSTGTVVLTSIPRDTLLYSECIGGYDKINHNGPAGGIECLESTLELAFDINIDYYMVIDFKGIMEIVDFLGGVYIDNPYGEFISQDSERQEGMIIVPEGLNLLNGEQTLAFARNRTQSNTDKVIDANVRSSNHVIVLEAMISRMKEQNIFSNVDEFVDLIGKYTLTNFPLNDLTSISNMALNLSSKNIFYKSLTVQGVDGSDYYSPSLGLPVYVYIPYQDSIDYISFYINMVYNQEAYYFDASFILTDEPVEELYYTT